jgi:hypothetical protein
VRGVLGDRVDVVRARLRARRAEMCRQLRLAADGWAEVLLVGLLAAGPSVRVRTVLVLGSGVAP